MGHPLPFSWDGVAEEMGEMGQEMTLTYGAFLKEHLKCLVVFCLFVCFLSYKEEGKEGGWS